jgi:hypothetical protein
VPEVPAKEEGIKFHQLILHGIRDAVEVFL